MSAALLGTGGGGGFLLPISRFCPISRVCKPETEPKPNPVPAVGLLPVDDKLLYLFATSYL